VKRYIDANVMTAQDAPLGAQRPSAATSLPPLPLNDDYRRGIALIENVIRTKGGADRLRILEAGCGNRWPLDLGDTRYTLTAVDVDPNALEMRKTRVRDVDEIMLGDLRTAELFEADRFDVIYNSFVLEHISGAEQVLDNFLKWLAPGGLLVLRFPDRDSVFGFLARSSPFWVHVAYKRYVEGIRNAGKPGFDPYPTSYDRIVSRRAMHRYCRDHGCTIRLETGYSGYLPRKPLARSLARVMVRAIGVASLGRLAWRHNNLTLVIEK
jgi:SAM-dependent methyltransferase